MNETKLNRSVGQWVAEHPRTARIFESLNIDYCCGGGKALVQACRDRQLDPHQVVERLERALHGEEGPAEDWTYAPLAALCDHIEQTHHAYLKRELPRLTAMIAKVVDAHGKSHPKLADVQQVFAGLRAELGPHMLKEERVLFPAIRQLEEFAEAPDFPFGTVANPINVMEHEHAEAGEALAQIRAITGDYALPAGACNTYRAMLDGLRELEADMHQHVHKENNILFPRALELEGARRPVRTTGVS